MSSDGEGNGLPPDHLVQLKVWLRALEADMRAAWLDSTADAYQAVKDGLRSTLASADAKTASVLEAALVENANRLRDDLAGSIGASFDELRDVLTAVRNESAASWVEQQAQLEQLRAVADELTGRAPASPGADGTTQSSSLDIEAAQNALLSSLAASEKRFRDELAASSGRVLTELQSAVAAVRAEQAQSRSIVAEVGSAVANLSEDLRGRTDGRGPDQFQAAVMAVQREQAQSRTQVGNLEASVNKLAAEMRERAAEIRDRMAEVRDRVPKTPLPAALAEATAPIHDKLGALQAAVLAITEDQAHSRAMATQLETAIANLSVEFLEAVTAGNGPPAATLIEPLHAKLAAVHAAVVDAREAQDEARKRISEDFALLGEMLVTDVRTAASDSNEALSKGLEKITQVADKRLGGQHERDTAWRNDVSTTLVACTETLAQGLDHIVRQVEQRLADHEQARQALGQELRAELREELHAALSASAAAQAKVFEDALMTLARAVSDERRSSAALMRASLNTTDENVRRILQRLDTTAPRPSLRPPARS